MMTSVNGNIFWVTGPLWGESTWRSPKIADTKTKKQASLSYLYEVRYTRAVVHLKGIGGHKCATKNFSKHLGLVGT